MLSSTKHSLRRESGVWSTFVEKKKAVHFDLNNFM